MKTLYLLLDLSIIIFPFLLSFDKKVHYIGHWKAVLGSLILVGLPFLVHDYFFTKMGIWGFNSDYLTGYYIFNLPIEEVLFFIVVPYACTFIYTCCKAYFEKVDFMFFNMFFYWGVLLYAVIIFDLGFGNWYSMIAALFAIVFGLIAKFIDNKYLPISICLSMIPFYIANSILTGSFTVEPIVWYDNSQNIGFRWGTIPAEDILYSFLLVGGNILVFHYLADRTRAIVGRLQGA